MATVTFDGATRFYTGNDKPAVDNLDLEDAFAVTQELGRSEFHLAMHPLLIQGGTGSPATPVATF